MDAVEFNKLHDKCTFEVDSLKRQLNLLKKVAKMEERLAMDALKLLGSSKSAVSIPSGEKVSANVTAITEAKELGFRVRERYASKFIFEVSQAEGNLDSIVARMKKITKESKRATDTIAGLKKKVAAERESCMTQWQRLNEELTSKLGKKAKLDKAQSKTSALFKRLDERIAALNNAEKDHRQNRKDLCAVLSDIFGCQRSMVKVTRTEAGDSIAAYSNALGELRVPLIRKVPSQKKLVDRYVSSLRVHNTNLPCTWSDVRQHRKPGDTHSVPKLKPQLDELEPKARRAKKREENGEDSADSDSELHVESDAVFVDGLRSNWGDRGAPQILSTANHVDDHKSRTRGRSRHSNDAADRNDSDSDDDAESRRTERSRRSDFADSRGGSERSSSHSSKASKSTRDRKRAAAAAAAAAASGGGSGSGQSKSMPRSPASRASVGGSTPDPISILGRPATTHPQSRSPRKPAGGGRASTAPSTPHETLSRSQTSSPAAAVLSDTEDDSVSWSTSNRRKRANGNPFRPSFKSSATHTSPSYEGLSPLDLMDTPTDTNTSKGHDDPFAGLAIPDDDDEFEDFGGDTLKEKKSNGSAGGDFESFDSFKNDDWGGFDDF